MAVQQAFIETLTEELPCEKRKVGGAKKRERSLSHSDFVEEVAEQPKTKRQKATQTTARQRDSSSSRQQDSSTRDTTTARVYKDGPIGGKKMISKII